MESLAQYLGIQVEAAEPERDAPLLEDGSLTAQQFADAVVQSVEFRRYILNGLAAGDLPAAVVCRILDQSWGSKPTRVEHTGKDGQPIASITEVRRVVVHVHREDEQEDTSYITH